jgi:hypothetical protein
MPGEPLALSTVPPPATADTDYDAICAAVTATARGRWFLDEFAKRNRNSDTSEVLAAIARMEATVVGERTKQASREAHQEVQIELLEMARTIAQARAEAVESRPATARGAAETSSAISPDVAAAAERLRQIAWTMRACGVELPASDQIGQIAETILSADALRGLGEQRAQKLTEALGYLEQRIDRMLEGHRAAAGSTETTENAEAAANRRRDPDPPLATAAVAMIAAAMRANAEQAAEAAPVSSAAVATTSSEGVESATSDIAEYPMDDDVVLTVADNAVAPVAAASLAAEPVTAATIMAEPVAVASVTAETVEPAQTADNALAAQTTDDATVPQDERAEFEFEPLTPANAPTAEDAAEAEFGGLELEPLAVVPTIAAGPPNEPQAAAAEDVPPITAQQELDEPLPATAASADDDVAAETPVSAPLPTTVAAQPDTGPAAPDLDTNDDQPPLLATAPATGEAEAAETDAISLQVEQDLDDLAGDARDRASDDAATEPAAAQAREPAPYPQLVHTTAREDEPAEFLLEEAPRKVPVSALVASAQASRAQLSDTLAAIESELFGSTRPPTDAPSDPAEASIPAKPARAPAAQGPLAAVMAMSEEERIALFS